AEHIVRSNFGKDQDLASGAHKGIIDAALHGSQDERTRAYQGTFGENMSHWLKGEPRENGQAGKLGMADWVGTAFQTDTALRRTLYSLFDLQPYTTENAQNLAEGLRAHIGDLVTRINDTLPPQQEKINLADLTVNDIFALSLYSFNLDTVDTPDGMNAKERFGELLNNLSASVKDPDNDSQKTCANIDNVAPLLNVLGVQSGEVMQLILQVDAHPTDLTEDAKGGKIYDDEAKHVAFLWKHHEQGGRAGETVPDFPIMPRLEPLPSESPALETSPEIADLNETSGHPEAEARRDGNQEIKLAPSFVERFRRLSGKPLSQHSDLGKRFWVGDPRFIQLAGEDFATLENREPFFAMGDPDNYPAQRTNFIYPNLANKHSLAEIESAGGDRFTEGEELYKNQGEPNPPSSYMIGIAAVSAETPEKQAALYLANADVVLQVHGHNGALMEEFLNVQNGDGASLQRYIGDALRREGINLQEFMNTYFSLGDKVREEVGKQFPTIMDLDEKLVNASTQDEYNRLISQIQSDPNIVRYQQALIAGTRDSQVMKGILEKSRDGLLPLRFDFDSPYGLLIDAPRTAARLHENMALLVSAVTNGDLTREQSQMLTLLSDAVNVEEAARLIKERSVSSSPQGEPKEDADISGNEGDPRLSDVGQGALQIEPQADGAPTEQIMEPLGREEQGRPQEELVEKREAGRVDEERREKNWGDTYGGRALDESQGRLKNGQESAAPFVMEMISVPPVREGNAFWVDAVRQPDAVVDGVKREIGFTTLEQRQPVYRVSHLFGTVGTIREEVFPADASLATDLRYKEVKALLGKPRNAEEGLLLGLSGASAETPAKQAELYTGLALVVIEAHKQNPGLLREFLEAQQNTSSEAVLAEREKTVVARQWEEYENAHPIDWSSYTMEAGVQQQEQIRTTLSGQDGRLLVFEEHPESEAIGKATINIEATVAGWTGRVENLGDRLRENQPLTPEQMRQIEFLAHAVDVTKVMRWLQGENPDHLDNEPPAAQNGGRGYMLEQLSRLESVRPEMERFAQKHALDFVGKRGEYFFLLSEPSYDKALSRLTHLFPDTANEGSLLRRSFETTRQAFLEKRGEVFSDPYSLNLSLFGGMNILSREMTAIMADTNIRLSLLYSQENKIFTTESREQMQEQFIPALTMGEDGSPRVSLPREVIEKVNELVDSHNDSLDFVLIEELLDGKMNPTEGFEYTGNGSGIAFKSAENILQFTEETRRKLAEFVSLLPHKFDQYYAILRFYNWLEKLYKKKSVYTPPYRPDAPAGGAVAIMNMIRQRVEESDLDSLLPSDAEEHDGHPDEGPDVDSREDDSTSDETGAYLTPRSPLSST
ncbi:MAG TPA: hypothetical protein VN711_02210, partial [Candidatus Saccharimonadales bacterium]|nr:hypothetical protein [Candidatus Saccharimonadales bacterium]